ncbi:hypothetical protein VMCG_08551 [Cytospora schulzeri]|uniref:Glycosyl transferase family 1 domain-containing protein n=1 Tax=Cytospora schulzeri TaxID=448051 RepID=A0A423VW10_9PEZI|nr:hypothetical protein VMCG_08551 [Valsa malicola]
MTGSHCGLSVFPTSLKEKKILLCTESFGPVNGVSRTTLMLVNHLRANGCHIAIVAPHNSTRINTFDPFASPGEIGASQVHNGSTSKHIEVRVNGYPLPFNPELSIAYPVRLSTLYRRTFGCLPDLIYLASPASLGFQVMLQLRQQSASHQVPVICNFQTDLAGYSKTLFPCPLGDIADYTLAAVQTFLFRHPCIRTIFYPSTYVKQYLEKHHVESQKMEILTRGVDAELFHPSKRNDTLRQKIAPNGETILICVARLAGEKSFDFLALAAEELEARGLDFKLYIVGGNRQVEVEAEIKDLFEALVRKGRVIFAGFKIGEALAEAYSSADLFLHCSVSETFGLVVLESFASGVPVVARDMGGPSDTITDGVDGYLTPPGDLGSFVDRVILLTNDKKLRNRLGDKALTKAREATWEKINNKVAWKMIDTIEQREDELVDMQPQGGDEQAQCSGMSSVSIIRLVRMLSDAVRETVVGYRSAAALGIILGFWGLVGIYLVFTKASRWVRGFFSNTSRSVTL